MLVVPSVHHVFIECSLFFGKIERRALVVEEHENLKNRVCTEYPGRLSVRIWFKAMWSLNVINARDAWPSASLYCRRDSRFFNFEPWEWLALGVWLPWWRIDSDNPHLTDRSTWQMFANVAHRKQTEYMCMCMAYTGCEKYACAVHELVFEFLYFQKTGFWNWFWPVHVLCVKRLYQTAPTQKTRSKIFR